MTGLDVTANAYNILGVTYIGQTVSPEAQAVANLALNNMLAEWNAQGLAIFSIVKNTFQLIPNLADYVVGPGGTGQFGTVPRPEKIESWAGITSSGAENGGKPVDSTTFVALAKDRSASGSVVQALNYDAAFPAGTIHLYPIPNAGAGFLELWVWEQMTTITDFTQPVLFPPGYLKAICYNLAIDLAPIFGRPLDPTVKLVADQTKQTLGATNISETTRNPQQVAK